MNSWRHLDMFLGPDCLVHYIDTTYVSIQCLTFSLILETFFFFESLLWLRQCSKWLLFAKSCTYSQSWWEETDQIPSQSPQEGITNGVPRIMPLESCCCCCCCRRCGQRAHTLLSNQKPQSWGAKGQVSWPWSGVVWGDWQRRFPVTSCLF